MRVCNADCLFLEEIDNYTELSYLRKSEIVHIYCRFKELGDEVTKDLHHRFEKSRILEVFPELSFNPFVDRIFHVFSSLKDEKMSFEDVLDLASAFSEDCPIDVKAQWAFLMFDFDGDQLLNQDDIAEIVSRLTKSVENSSDDESHCLSEAETKQVAEILFNNVVLCHSEGITCMEFINERIRRNGEYLLTKNMQRTVWTANSGMLCQQRANKRQINGRMNASIVNVVKISSLNKVGVRARRIFDAYKDPKHNKICYEVAEEKIVFEI